MAETVYERGMRIRRQVLGEEHVARAEARKTDLDADFQRFITETAWGKVWARGTLDLKTRHLVTIGMLVACGKDHELPMHLRATRNTGVTREELKEVFLQAALYAGLPAANRAFAVAKQVFDEAHESGGAP